MPNLFHPSSNTVFKAIIVGGALSVPGIIGAGYAINMTWGYKTYVPIDQPVQFSHKHHVLDDGIDCRYCHTSVEKSTSAGMPDTHTCMSCHSQIWSDSPELAPVRASYASGQPINWNRVHDLPDFVYFNHSMHVNKGVGCEECHGRIDQMPLAQKVHTFSMEWCLDCHRHPEEHLRPKEAIFTMGFEAKDAISEKTGKPYTSQAELGRDMVYKYKIQHPRQLTDCYTCHH